MKRIFYLACLLFVLVALWMARYTIFPVAGTRGAYKLDRFRGEVTILIGDSEYDVTYWGRFQPSQRWERGDDLLKGF